MKKLAILALAAMSTVAFATPPKDPPPRKCAAFAKPTISTSALRSCK